jgi:hypothetical protein
MLAISGHGTQTSSAQARGGVRIGVAVDKPSFVLHAPVFAILTIQNDLGEPITFDLGRDSKSSLNLSIAPPNGKTVVVSYPTEDGISLFAQNTLAAGQTYTQRLLLNEWYGFSAPGPYSVEVASTAQFKTSGGRGVQLSPGNKIMVQIGPKDDESLRSVCADLALRATAAGPVQNRVDAAVALSFVRDPVAIPFLRQVVERGVSAQQYGIEGLSRIGSTDAVEALIANATSRDPEVKRLVTRELRRIENTTADPALKARIRSALQL